MGVTYTGFDEAAQKLGSVEFSSLVSEVFDEVGSGMTSEMEGIVPVDTGFLQSTIVYSLGDMSVTIEVTAEYAGYVEYGTYKMGAQPYFNPVIDNWVGSGQIESLFVSAINQRLQEI